MDSAIEVLFAVVIGLGMWLLKTVFSRLDDLYRKMEENRVYVLQNYAERQDVAMIAENVKNAQLALASNPNKDDFKELQAEIKESFNKINSYLEKLNLHLMKESRNNHE